MSEVNNKPGRYWEQLDKHWQREIEVKKIISETDPQKFPNTISDKTLSTEEKLEFISAIVWGMGMDFQDAEHQISCHQDTLADSYRSATRALNQIHCITAMSVEEIDKMENGIK